MMLAPCNLLLGEVLKAVEALLETENMFFWAGRVLGGLNLRYFFIFLMRSHVHTNVHRPASLALKSHFLWCFILVFLFVIFIRSQIKTNDHKMNLKYLT